MRLPGWLDRPIITVLIGVFFTAIIVPIAARRWARKQKEQEVKTDLVSDIAITMMQLITRATTARKSIFAQHPQGRLHPIRWPYSVASEAVKEELAKFGLKRQVIGTRLEAYFGWVGIPQHWDDLCDYVEQLCELWDIPPGSSCQQLEDLNRKIERLWKRLGLTRASRTEAKRDLERDLKKENGKVDRKWRWARIRLLYCKANIIRQILTEPMPVFASWPSKAKRAYLKAKRKRVESPHGVRAT